MSTLMKVGAIDRAPKSDARIGSATERISTSRTSRGRENGVPSPLPLGTPFTAQHTRKFFLSFWRTSVASASRAQYRRKSCASSSWRTWSTWSTWSAVGSLTSKAGELRSAPSGPDDRDRVAGKIALALGGARSQGKGRKVNTGLRGLVPCTGFPLNCRTPPLLGASGHGH